MELIFNELSVNPPSNSDNEVEARFRQLIHTFKESKTRYQFSHIRFPERYSDMKVTKTKTLYEWVHSMTDRTFRSLLLAILKQPFMDSLDDPELERYLEGKYSLMDQNVPSQETPLGFPIAYIKKVPTISLCSHPFWEARKIQMKLEKNGEEFEIFVYNLSKESDLTSVEIDEWGKNYLASNTITQSEIVKYLNFRKYKIIFTNVFSTQFYELKSTDAERFKKLIDLMKDVETHPFTGGLGKTEALKHSEKASKRSSHGDRLVYSLKDDTVTFFECKTHYRDN